MKVAIQGFEIRGKIAVINNSKGNEIMIGETPEGDFIITQTHEGEEITVGYVQPIGAKPKQDIVLNLRTLVHEKATDNIRVGKTYQYSMKNPLSELKASLIAMYTDDTITPEDFFKRCYSRVVVVDAVTLTPVITIYEDKLQGEAAL